MGLIAHYPLNNTLASIFNKAVTSSNQGDGVYERIVELALTEILNYIESKEGNYTKSGEDMFDYESEYESEEYSDEYDDEDFEVDDYGKASPTPLLGDDDTYKAMNNSELQSLIDDALDVRDMDEVKRLAGYLKESLRIQLENKLHILNESKYSHINSYHTLLYLVFEMHI